LGLTVKYPHVPRRLTTGNDSSIAGYNAKAAPDSLAETFAVVLSGEETTNTDVILRAPSYYQSTGVTKW
jgi:hypothetical protein